jgi:hypothetical protein
MPIVFWAYVNNVHEITVSLFTTAAVYYFVCATEKKYVYFNLYFLFGTTSAGCVQPHDRRQVGDMPAVHGGLATHSCRSCYQGPGPTAA